MVSMMIRHELACSDERFWELHFDREFSARLFRALGFSRWEVITQTEDETELVRVVEGAPKLDVPGPIAGLIGPRFSYREEGRFDRAKKTYTYGMSTPLGDKLRTSGILRCEPRTERTCVRTVELEAVVKVFVFGSMLEAATERTLRDGWNRSAVYFNDWLKKQDLAKP